MSETNETTKGKIDNIQTRLTRIEITQNEIITPLMQDIKNSVKKLENERYITQDDADKRYVTKEEFKPVRTFLYGAISAIIVGLITLAFKALEK